MKDKKKVILATLKVTAEITSDICALAKDESNTAELTALVNSVISAYANAMGVTGYEWFKNHEKVFKDTQDKERETIFLLSILSMKEGDK